MAPRGRRVDRLAERGAKFHAAATSEYILSPAKAEVVAEVARLLDEIDDQRRRLALDGPVVRGTGLTTKEHPIAGALRANRRLLGDLLRLLELPDPDGEE
jgi:hypothetical protein